MCFLFRRARAQIKKETSRGKAARHAVRESFVLHQPSVPLFIHLIKDGQMINRREAVEGGLGLEIDGFVFFSLPKINTALRHCQRSGESFKAFHACVRGRSIPSVWTHRHLLAASHANLKRNVSIPAMRLGGGKGGRWALIQLRGNILRED